ncbi:MAG: hypothetical protein IJ520_06195 [Synergistaceae bacterium]|nr:hypothetical protein [Synergistaceae bacterium]
MDIDELLATSDISERFCEGCEAIRCIKGGLEEPDDYECELCSWDISDSKCLKYDAYCRMRGAVEVIDEAIAEEGSYCCYE